MPSRRKSHKTSRRKSLARSSKRKLFGFGKKEDYITSKNKEILGKLDKLDKYVKAKKSEFLYKSDDIIGKDNKQYLLDTSKQVDKQLSNIDISAKGLKEKLINELDNLLPDFGKIVMLEILNELPTNIKNILIASIISILTAPVSPSIMLLFIGNLGSLYAEQLLMNINNRFLEDEEMTNLTKVILILADILYLANRFNFNIIQSIISILSLKVFNNFITKFFNIFGITLDNVIILQSLTYLGKRTKLINKGIAKSK